MGAAVNLDGNGTDQHRVMQKYVSKCTFNSDLLGFVCQSMKVTHTANNPDHNLLPKNAGKKVV